jgi:hypothetical protein
LTPRRVDLVPRHLAAAFTVSRCQGQ